MRDDQRVPAGPQAQLQRAGVQQHLVARLAAAGQRRIGQGQDRCARDRHARARPRRPTPGRSRATTPLRHLITPAGQRRAAPPGRSCMPADKAGGPGRPVPAPRQVAVGAGGNGLRRGKGQRDVDGGRPSDCSAWWSACSRRAGTSPRRRSGKPCPAIRSPSTRSSACSSGTRTSCGSSASRWRRAQRRPRRRGRLPDPAPGLRAARDQAGAGRGGRARAWPPGSGGGPSWPGGRRAPCSSCGPRGSTRRRPSQPGIEPRLQTGEAAFGPLWEAVRDRRPVTFGYRAAGRSTAQQRQPRALGRGEPARPLVRRRAGHRPRRAERVFRLSRIDGPVTFAGPAGRGDRAAGHRRARGGPRLGHRAAGAAHRRAAGPLRRRARPAPAHAASAEPDPERPGWDLAELPFSDVGW